MVEDADDTTRPPALVVENDDAAPDSEQLTRILMDDSRSFKSFRKFMDHDSRQRFWFSLPTVTKATLALSFVTSFVLISYAIVMVSLADSDEEAHVAATIIILSAFQFLVSVEAVIYENTIQLIASILLNFLMMVRVLWFIASKDQESAYLALKVAWGAVVCAVVMCYIACSLMSCRTFGWRFYSRLGVDFRRPGAKAIMQMTFVTNVFNTLLKFDFVLLVVFCALGIIISVEGRDQLQVPIFVVSICTFFVNLGISIIALWMASSRWKWKRKWLIHVLMPLSLAGPIAVIAIYYDQEQDIANAATSTLIAGIVFMVVRLLLWATYRVVSNDTQMVIVGARATLRREAVRVSSWNKFESNLAEDEKLAPLLRGAWLGKPTPRNPKKTRFFQLSHDASTLRWGWSKFVRMYYVEDIHYSPEELSIRMKFLPEGDLLLEFPDSDTFDVWQAGIERLMVVLMSPEANKEGGADLVAVGGLAAPASRDDEESGLMQMLFRSFSVRRSSGTVGLTSSLETRPTDSSYVKAPKEVDPPLSTNQLQKRQRMASYLFRTPTSPLSWMGSFRREGRSGSTPTPTGKIVMVSVGTRMDPSDLAYLDEINEINDIGETDAGADGEAGVARRETDDDKNADIAAQYAAMLAGFGGPPAGSSPGGQQQRQERQERQERQQKQQTGHKPPRSLPRPPASPLLSENSAAPQSSSKPAATSPPGSIVASSLQLVDRLRARSPAAASAGSPPGSLGVEHPSPHAGPSGHAAGLMVSVEVVEFGNITMGKLLGSGSEGDVHAAWYLESPVAIKRFNRLEDASYEAGMYLTTGTHDNIVSLRALCQHLDNIYLVMEYCPRGTLDSLLHYTSRSVQWDPVNLLPIIRGICRGMYHLHSRGILHRDIKPANIFIGHGSTMKIGDFGMACIVAPGQPSVEEFVKTTPDEVFELVGTMQYTAPELINRSLRSRSSDVDLLEISKKVDVYSFGVTLWEILERRRPFEGLDALAIQGMWLNAPYTAHRTANFPKLNIPTDARDPIKLKVYRSLSDLIDDCLRLDAAQRPSFKDVLTRLKEIKDGR